MTERPSNGMNGEEARFLAMYEDYSVGRASLEAAVSAFRAFVAAPSADGGIPGFASFQHGDGSLPSADAERLRKFEDAIGKLK